MQAAVVPLTRLRDALAWRLRKLVGDRFVDRAIVNVAQRWRRLLKKPVFIGITGSAGKTTTRGLLLGILAHKGRGTGTRANFNRPTEVAETILRLRPTHDFCVAELSEGRPGELDGALALLQPAIGIVTVVGDDHWSAYGSHDAIAKEIGKLIAFLPPTGTAVINADDERVLAMAANCAAKVLTYGVSPNAELRGEGISAVWPDRLQMTLVRGAERVPLRTQLCGPHWIPSVLGAVGGGLATGLSLDECAEGIASAEPPDGRMQPVTTPDGVAFLRDDFKAPLWTVDACFDFMMAARAKRKIIVIGTLSDHGAGAGASKKYATVAQRAQDIADFTVFVGPWASSALKARRPGREDALRAFNHVRDAAGYVNSIARDGDLVLLKGTNLQDHLLRIVMARTNEIACWRDDCERNSFCNECPDRNKPSGPPPTMEGAVASDRALATAPAAQRVIDPGEQVIVGLGNPGPKYAGTPHNVGYEVVDRLAATLGLTWDTTPEAWIARGSSPQCRVCLIKIRTGMNRIGTGLKQLSESMSFRPEQCILVFDDLDMPTGSVRTRLSGSAGGHRGVASVLEAFQTDAFRRIKVGVGQPGVTLNRIEYVLTPFDAGSRVAVDEAIPLAEARALDMVAPHSRAP